MAAGVVERRGVVERVVREEVGVRAAVRRPRPVVAAAARLQGCQMVLDEYLDRMCLALRASGLWLCYAALQNLIPSLPWIAPPLSPPWRNPRKGKDKIL